MVPGRALLVKLLSVSEGDIIEAMSPQNCDMVVLERRTVYANNARFISNVYLHYKVHTSQPPQLRDKLVCYCTSTYV